MTIGIIAEYNPFHNGHLYLINKIKEKYKDATIISVITGNFTERGDVSIIDKFKKAEIAVKNGIDIVVELPFVFSTQSADYFSYGALTILNYLKVDLIVFGSENNNIEDLETVADIQLNNSKFDSLVQIHCKMGCSYPKALSNAVYDLTNKQINTPNDLLGISYIKIIKKYNYNIKYECIKRTNDYHSKTLEEISSSTALREALINNKDIKKYIPKNSYKYYNNLHFLEDYFPFLKYKIITDNNLEDYTTTKEGDHKRLIKYIKISNSYIELINNLKHKNITENKIRRLLIHILCNYKKDIHKKFNKIEYIRILKINSKGKRYLNSIKKDINIKIISKISKNKPSMLEYELYTTNIYNLINKNSISEENNIIYIGDEEND